MKRTGRSRTSGQTLALFALAMPAMLALMALGLDGAQIFLERRDAQSAADLAALGGVLSLPDDAATAKSNAKTIGAAHGYPMGSVTPITPYDGSASKIEVTVNSQVDTFFMSILNLFTPGDYSTVDVSARAVAEVKPGVSGSGNYAVYSLMPCGEIEDFKALEWQGNFNTVVGSIHSNAGADFSGENNGVSDMFDIECTKAELYDTGKDSFTMSATNPDIIGSTGEPPACTGSEGPGTVCHAVRGDPPYPHYDGSMLDGALCTGGLWSSDHDFGGTLSPGIYCVKGKATVTDYTTTSASPSSPGVTIIAYEFDIPGKGINLWAHTDNILFYAYKDYPTRVEYEVISISGDNCTGSNNDHGDPDRGYLEGLIMAPYGEVKFSGNCYDVYGGLLGWRAEWGGNYNHIIGELGASVADEPSIAIIE